MNSYSLKANDSIDPIKEGYILKLKKPYKVKNPQVGAVIEHDAYIWIMKIHKEQKNSPPKDRPVLITRILIPRIKDLRKKYIISRSKVQKETVIKYLLEYGYDIHAKNMSYYYRRHDYYKFYIAVGLIRIGLDNTRNSTL